MESIEQMINRLCPNGVEWKKISEIGTIYRGVAFSKKDFTETGTPCIHYGQIYTKFGNSAYKTYTYVSEQLSKGKKLAQKGDLVMAVTSENMEDVGKCLAWLGEEDILVSNHACYIRHSLNPMYLAYYLQSVHFFNYKKKISKGVKVIDLDLNMFGDMLIPVPPMEIQNRIVEVLDKMTSLEAELEAELEARKKQYEYYRNKLLSFNKLEGGGIERVVWKKISEIGTVTRGTSFQKKHFTAEGTPCIHYGQIYTKYAHHVYETISFVGDEISRFPKRAKKGAVVIATTSENIEDVGKCIVWLGEEDVIVSNDACFIQHTLNPKYLGYVFQTESFTKYKKKVATGTKVIRINADAVADFLIPVPPLEIQERIVSILDRFEALTTDLQTGLPAEIDARKRQLEYYRNKLLTFERAS